MPSSSRPSTLRPLLFPLTAVFLLAAACGGPPPEPAVPAPPTSPPAPKKPAVAEAPPAAAAKVEPCSTLETCAKEARELGDRRDGAAREVLARACHLGSAPHCSEAGRAWLTEPADKGRALASFAHACGAASPDVDACAEVVALRAEAGEEPRALRAEAEMACKAGGRDAAAKKARASACMVLASARMKEGAASSDARVASAYHEACGLGSDEGCKAEKANAKPELLAGANLHVDGISGNGMKLDEVACKTEGLGGMFGAMTLAASFAPRKARLDACAKSKTEVVVRWVGRGGAMTDIHASGAPAAVNTCVERALAGSKIAMGGACAARFALR